MAQLDNSLLKTSSTEEVELLHQQPLSTSPSQDQQIQPPLPKKRRNQPGMPDPEAEVVALSPKTLLATNRFVCEICGKGFQRDQNLQLHRRGHNLPWKLKQRGPKESVKKKVYVCPEQGCVHHNPRRALGDLTGIKKHFCRKHGDKKWKCERCSKNYAVLSDWKAHLKICGTRQYKCDCGTIFSRRDSFVTHRAFCDALAQESAKVQKVSGGSRPGSATPISSTVVSPVLSVNQSSEMQETKVLVTTSTSSASCNTSCTSNHKDSDNGKQNGIGNGDDNLVFHSSMFAPLSIFSPSMSQNTVSSFPGQLITMPNTEQPPVLSLSPFYEFPSTAAPASLLQDHDSYSTAPTQAAAMSATALLQKAAQMGAASSGTGSSCFCGFGLIPSQHQQGEDSSVKLENESMVADRLVQLPSPGNFNGSGPVMDDPSTYFGSKPMTLDFLGLGDSSSAAHAYLSSIGSPIDVAVATFQGGSDSLVKVSWDGFPE